MNILIIGGGRFLGAATLDAALASGHSITVFNRGRARSAWPEGVEILTGDRHESLASFEGRRWDAVVDTCGYVPDEVRSSTRALRDCGRYLFVSSISVYATPASISNDLRIDERQPLLDANGIAHDDRGMEHYGAQKAACEREVNDAFGDRALIVRPGLIVGPNDPTGRFDHWPWRAAETREMLVPDVADGEPLQFIDVRDLAAFMVGLIERVASGSFNATGPSHGTTVDWRALIDACGRALRERGVTPARPVRVNEAFLLRENVQPWSELPLWVPSTDPEAAVVSRVDLTKAEAAGLRTRPLIETIAAVLDQSLPLPDDPRRRGKLGLAREAELLARSASSFH